MNTDWRRRELLDHLQRLARNFLTPASEEAYRLAETTVERGPKLELERIGERLGDAIAAIKAVR